MFSKFCWWNLPPCFSRKRRRSACLHHPAVLHRRRQSWPRREQICVILDRLYIYRYCVVYHTLFYSVLIYFILFYYTVLPYTVLHYTVFYYINCVVIFYVIRCITWHYVILYFVLLCYTILPYYIDINMISIQYIL